MKPMKTEIELRLIGNLLSDWCKQRAEKEESFIYQTGFDSMHRVIRFTSAMLQSLFVLPGNQKGYWENGNVAMYEIHNSPESVILSCTAKSNGLSKKESNRLCALASACNAFEKDGSYQLACWNISDEAENVNVLAVVLNQVLDFEISWFESELSVWKENSEHRVRAFPQDHCLLVNSSSFPDQIYMEGAQMATLTNRYERNPKARARCIAVHGSACKVCGFDFGIVFGEAFSGKIEVHHIKPISEIGKEYVVDPVKDLMPVCPNCHMMLHSKQEGVYSIEELKQLLTMTATAVD